MINIIAIPSSTHMTQNTWSSHAMTTSMLITMTSNSAIQLTKWHAEDTEESIAAPLITWPQTLLPITQKVTLMAKPVLSSISVTDAN